MRQAIAFASLSLLIAGTIAGQSFEVASVKPAPPPTSKAIRTTLNEEHGRVTYSFANLEQLITRAYNVKDYQVIGPDWLKSERYDVVATTSPDTSKEQVLKMVQGLLAERFHLVLHRENRELPVFALVAGKNGPKLKESKLHENGSMRVGLGHMDASGVAMPGLARALYTLVGRPVLDETGLSGNFDFTLDFALDSSVAGLAGAKMVAEKARILEAAADGPSIFTAVHEQLGLKLESRKAPVEVLVIDRADKVPTEN
jgi:uncharacterized protein (TIGR03435 family)